MCGCARVCNGVFVEYLRIYIGTQRCVILGEVRSFTPGERSLGSLAQLEAQSAQARR